MNAKPIATSMASHALPDTQAIHVLAEAKLRQASVRITRARVKVLAALLSANRAVSHHEVQDRFADMDRVTLYRALDCLIDAGLAHKIASDDRVFRYSAGTHHLPQDEALNADATIARHQHGHFKCTRCARIFCLDKKLNSPLAAGQQQRTLHQQLQSDIQESLGAGFQSHDIELTIKGWCADCGH